MKHFAHKVQATEEEIELAKQQQKDWDQNL